MRLNGLNTTELPKNEIYNIYDKESPYTTIDVRPLGKNETVATILDKRDSFNNLNHTCSGNATI